MEQAALRIHIKAAGWSHWRQSACWAGLSLFGLLLWLPVLAALWDTWQEENSLSHGPVILVLALLHLWGQRSRLRSEPSSSRLGLGLMIASLLILIVATYADVFFLRPICLLGMSVGAIGYVAGRNAFLASAGALGFMLFAVPWPTTLSERIAFPLQLMSSAYAAMFGGLLGMPIHREGIHLSVVPTPGAPPVYSVLVAQECSGLTSLIVLLALGYLIAYHTPVGAMWKGLLIASVVPLTLLANTVRLTLILLAGANWNASVAQWVHDHEAPVLIFFCSLGLMALRKALLSWLQSREEARMTHFRTNRNPVRRKVAHR